jgi:hypothetical protein
LGSARPIQTNGAEVSGLGQVCNVAGPRVYYSQDAVILRVNESEMATIRRIRGVSFSTGQGGDPASSARCDIGREEVFLIRDPSGPGDLTCIGRPRK